ncbi:MAG: hypothetical protein WDA75_09605 [Candidatus Latescibacterota bacterium]|jgi:hypothetical protein
MPYILRFVQRYRPADREAFMHLEARFAALERRRPDLPQGRRSQPYAGRDPANTLIWECEFPSLAATQEGLARIGADPEHAALYQAQVPYFLEAWTEISEVLDFPESGSGAR